MLDKKKVAMILAEVIGAFVLSLAFYSMIARTTFPLFSGLVGAGVLAMLVYMFSPVLGWHANPAVTLGLWSVRKVKTMPAIAAIAAQMVGGLLAWWLLTYFLGHSLTSMAGQKFDWKIFTGEALGGAVLLFGISTAAYQKFEGGKLAAVVGVSYLVAVVVASLASNGIVNPAVAVGIQSWSWAYAAGPIVGAIIGANLYALLFTNSGSSPLQMAASAVGTKSSSSKKPTVKTTKKKK